MLNDYRMELLQRLRSDNRDFEWLCQQVGIQKVVTRLSSVENQFQPHISPVDQHMARLGIRNNRSSETRQLVEHMVGSYMGLINSLSHRDGKSNLVAWWVTMDSRTYSWRDLVTGINKLGGEKFLSFYLGGLSVAGIAQVATNDIDENIAAVVKP